MVNGLLGNLLALLSNETKNAQDCLKAVDKTVHETIALLKQSTTGVVGDVASGATKVVGSTVGSTVGTVGQAAQSTIATVSSVVPVL